MLPILYFANCVSLYMRFWCLRRSENVDKTDRPWPENPEFYCRNIRFSITRNVLLPSFNCWCSKRRGVNAKSVTRIKSIAVLSKEKKERNKETGKEREKYREKASNHSNIVSIPWANPLAFTSDVRTSR